MKKDVAEIIEGFGFVQVGDGDFVEAGYFAREVSLDTDALEGRDDEERRGFEVDGIAQTLLEGVFQPGLFPFEFPDEVVLEVGIGATAGDGFLEGEAFFVAESSGVEVTDKLKEIQKPGLRFCGFAERFTAPFGDEFRWSHLRWAGHGAGIIASGGGC